jgi:hypothetical protein
MRHAEDEPMHRVIESPPPGSLLRIVAVAAAATVLAVVLDAGVAAQTLTDPNPQTKRSPPPAANAKPASAARVKTCSAYGPGFVNMPGTDACMKIGGFVRMEGTNAPGN